MIQRAGLGVAYYAKPVIAAAAGASIDAHGDSHRAAVSAGLLLDAEIVKERR